jgi:hypothetical protein
MNPIFSLQLDSNLEVIQVFNWPSSLVHSGPYNLKTNHDTHGIMMKKSTHLFQQRLIQTAKGEEYTSVTGRSVKDQVVSF